MPPLYQPWWVCGERGFPLWRAPNPSLGQRDLSAPPRNRILSIRQVIDPLCPTMFLSMAESREKQHGSCSVMYQWFLLIKSNPFFFYGKNRTSTFPMGGGSISPSHPLASEVNCPNLTSSKPKGKGDRTEFQPLGAKDLRKSQPPGQLPCWGINPGASLE